MTTAVATRGKSAIAWNRNAISAAAALAAILVGVSAATVLPWLDRWPAEWNLPLRQLITAGTKWLVNDLDFGLFRFRDITRAFTWLLSWPLAWTEAALYKGFPSLGIAQLPWLAVTLGVAILAYWLKGRRLAVFCAGCCLYFTLFNLWPDTMRTLALVIVAVPFAAVTGLILGIAANRSRRVESIVTPMFDIMQATPHMAYLVPVVALFGLGQVPGMIATAIFAMPPMARCVILGLRTVPSDIVESGRMSGCTGRQLLWKVELPAAHQALMLGLNQVVMQTLAMAVLVSLVGVSGLGEKLLFSLQQLRLGKALEQGLAIVLIAIVLDRLTQAYAYHKPERAEARAPFWRRHRFLALFLAATVLSILAAMLLPELRTLPKELTVTTAPWWDSGIRSMSKNLFQYINGTRDWITLFILIPLRNFYLSIPWVVAVGLVGVLASHFGGWRTALLSTALLVLMVVTGFWVPLVMTVYLVSCAVAICILIGIPLGIWSARDPKVARLVLAACDTLQTFPSFIYLIPVVMLLRVGDLANIIAILAYATVPAIRFTYLGLKRIPAVTIEAAIAAGCTRRQLLTNVEMPMALPEVMLGVNQTIMMALAMTAITALIGSQDLGQEIYKARPDVDIGRALLAGLGIAFIGIIADRIIGAWANRRKAELGLTA
ncbi:MAG: ABC transporter permease [Dongiaceae bacterium]